MTAAPTLALLRGHVLDRLNELPEGSVQCVVTSPPYWGLRDYSRCGCGKKTGVFDPECEECGGVGQLVAGPRAAKKGLRTEDAYFGAVYKGCACEVLIFEADCPRCHGTGKDEALSVVWDDAGGCEHEWGAESVQVKGDWGHGPNRMNLEENRHPGLDGRRTQTERSQGSFCLRCPAWKGQLGLEPTPDLYIAHLVQVFREVRRVLRDDGTLWLNLGDSYAGSPVGTFNGGGFKDGSAATGSRDMSGVATSGTLDKLKGSGLKPKDLLMMPARVALALQADGWYIRSDIVWSKPNPMPESVTDRPTKAHEYIFLMSKSPTYYYDADAVRENHESSPLQNKWQRERGMSGLRLSPVPGDKREFVGGRAGGHPAGRNLRSVWTITTQPYKEAHFATFPEAIPERCIKAGTSQVGACQECGAGWERVSQGLGQVAEKPFNGKWASGTQEESGTRLQMNLRAAREMTGDHEPSFAKTTLAWRPTCDHYPDPCPECGKAWRKVEVKTQATRNETKTPKQGLYDEAEVRSGARFGGGPGWRKFVPEFSVDKVRVPACFCRVVPCVVLDPFAGSGTVLQVARGMGRSSIGIEIKEEYSAMARKRTHADVLPLPQP